LQMRELRLPLSPFCGYVLALVFVSFSAEAQTSAPNEWTWMGGNDTIGTSCSQVVFCGRPGVYGTLGEPASGNIPGSRTSASAWTDSSGNLWLFGGAGFDSNGSNFFLNDVWEFNPSTYEWTWMGGSSTINQSGVYGILRTPSKGNIPGARSSAASWTDSSGHFWLFGGWGMDGNGVYSALNDLWEFNPSTNEWTWMGGGTTVNQPSVNGTLGIPAAGNIPGGLFKGAGWTDSVGNFWLLGGLGYDSVGNLGYPDDLWAFDPSTNEWTWVKGSSTLGNICANGIFCSVTGTYGSLGTPAAGNLPGSRTGALSWTDDNGNLWLFFGIGYSTNGAVGEFNDVWEFNPSTYEWTWMGGGDSCSASGNCDPSGVYGTLGSAAAGNLPGGRDSSSTWTDSSGHLWLFGGEGDDAYGFPGLLNDIWEFNPSTDEWAWMGGSNSVGALRNPSPNGQPGVYGTLGTPASGNVPGGRAWASSWTDKSGHFWLFAGEGFDANGNWGYLNDLWEYRPSTAVFSTPNFSLAVAPASMTVAPGSSGSTKITVAPTGGFNSAVSFACSGLPSGGSCSFSPATVTPSGGTAATTTLTVNPTNSTAVNALPHIPIVPSLAFAAAFCFVGVKKRRDLLTLLVPVAFAGLGLVSGCGSRGGSGNIGGEPSPVISTVTVTATAGPLQQTATFSLTVN
jgi:N-acetylneuraminic acid mutarotase